MTEAIDPQASSRLEQQVRTLTERVVQLKGELAQALARVSALTTVDEATGLLTWRAFAERAAAEIARAARYQREIGLIVISAEPSLVRRLAEMFRSHYRDCDVAGVSERGEIVLLLPETSFEGALVMGRRLSSCAAKGRCEAVRIGCVSWPQHGRTLTAVLASARAAAPAF